MKTKVPVPVGHPPRMLVYQEGTPIEFGDACLFNKVYPDLALPDNHMLVQLPCGTFTFLPKDAIEYD